MYEQDVRKQEVQKKVDSQARWWCPGCSSYLLPREVWVKEFRYSSDWDDTTAYHPVCSKCSGNVREPDASNCKEVMINFVEGVSWEDVSKQLNTAEINAFSFMCGEWKSGYMSQEKKLEYENILTLKDINKFSEFLNRWNYQPPFV